MPELEFLDIRFQVALHLFNFVICLSVPAVLSHRPFYVHGFVLPN